MQITMGLPTAQMATQKNCFLAVPNVLRKAQRASCYGFDDMTQGRE